MSTISSTFSGTELTSSARLQDHDVDVAPKPREAAQGTGGASARGQGLRRRQGWRGASGRHRRRDDGV